MGVQGSSPDSPHNTGWILPSSLSMCAAPAESSDHTVLVEEMKWDDPPPHMFQSADEWEVRKMSRRCPPLYRGMIVQGRGIAEEIVREKKYDLLLCDGLMTLERIVSINDNPHRTQGEFLFPWAHCTNINFSLNQTWIQIPSDKL